MTAWKQLFACMANSCLIVPGVSMGGEALAVLCENFDFIGTGNFMECYCRYAYPSGSEDLSVSQKIKQSRIPDFTFDEEELEFLSGE